MAEKPPFQASPYDVEEMLARRPGEPSQRDSLGQAWMDGPNRFSSEKALQGSLERYRRPGDTTGFTPGANPEMEGLAADLGNRQSSWWEKLIAAAGLGTGIVQGKVKGGKPAAAPRELDKLGFYSQALEAAKGLQRKSGPAQGFLNDLTKAGVKKAELQATGLDKWLEKRADAQAPVNREELIEFLRQNRVQVQETRYGGEDRKDAVLRGVGRERDEDGNTVLHYEESHKGRSFRVTEDRDAGNVYVEGPNGEHIPVATPMNRQSRVDAERAIHAWMLEQDAADAPKDVVGPIKWKRSGGQNLLLDPENPSNRESVVHIGGKVVQVPGGYSLQYGHDSFAMDHLSGKPAVWDTKEAAEKGQTGSRADGAYREPHFDSVPNYLFHLRTGLYRDAQGRQVLLGDEAQSTRAQAIRDSKAGPRDEAKIAELRERLEKAKGEHEEAYDVAERWLYDNGWPPMAGGRMATHEEIYGALQRKYTDTPTERPQGTPGVMAHDGKPMIESAFRHLNAINKPDETHRLLAAELDALERAPSGHPLVSTMNQVDTTMLRRLIQQAVESKAEGLALTPGDLQNERYSLSKHVGALRYFPDSKRLRYLDPEQAQRVRAIPARETDVRWEAFGGEHKPDDLPGIVGKEVAAKLLGQPLNQGSHLLHLDTEIGGQDMREYYDKTYPNVIEKELRRLDPQWPGRGTTTLKKPESPEEAKARSEAPWASERSPYPMPFHHFPITDKVREEVAKGLPLFSAAALAPLLGNLFPRSDRVEVTEENPFDYAP